jgi:glyoxylase-like metal-dependent hydrolase (beta-lactamase superfamily II)
VNGLSTLLKKLPYIKAYVHPLDIPYIHQSNNISASRMTPTCTPLTTTIKIGTRTKIRFIHTPGHTPGSQSLLVNDIRLLSGDTLLGGICGRTDLPGGSRENMEHTLRHVLGEMDDRVVVLPGHDYGSDWSTIGIERDKGCLGDDLVGFGFHTPGERESMESLSTVQTSSTMTGFSSGSSMSMDMEREDKGKAGSMYSLSFSSVASLGRKTSLRRR